MTQITVRSVRPGFGNLPPIYAPSVTAMGYTIPTAPPVVWGNGAGWAPGVSGLGAPGSKRRPKRRAKRKSRKQANKHERVMTGLENRAEQCRAAAQLQLENPALALPAHCTAAAPPLTIPSIPLQNGGFVTPGGVPGLSEEAPYDSAYLDTAAASSGPDPKLLLALGAAGVVLFVLVKRKRDRAK